jgi:hypothetical protein
LLFIFVLNDQIIGNIWLVGAWILIVQAD